MAGHPALILRRLKSIKLSWNRKGTGWSSRLSSIANKKHLFNGPIVGFRVRLWQHPRGWDTTTHKQSTHLYYLSISTIWLRQVTHTNLEVYPDVVNQLFFAYALGRANYPRRGIRTRNKNSLGYRQKYFT